MSLEKKDVTWWNILTRAIELDIYIGHKRWSYTQLAKSANVSRAIIYHYFGQEKDEILLQACHLFGEYLAGVTPKQIKYYSEKNFSEGLKVARRMFMQYPSLLQFYWLHRLSKSEIGKLIRKYEKKADVKRKDFFPEFTNEQRNILQAIQMGLATYPELDESSLDSINSLIMEIAKLPSR